MNKAKTILELIETVDPENVVSLDVIDAAVWCYLNHKKMISLHPNYPEKHGFWIERENSDTALRVSFTPYTRSRDELKKIRPKGCELTIFAPNNSYAIVFFGCNRNMPADKEFYSPKLPTEELAELHAIIKAIDWKRHNE